MIKNELCIAMIAHNQFALVKQQLKNISRYIKENVSVVIIDQCSEDGLREWLCEQREFDYILCDEQLENYAAILNTIINEFALEKDLLILSPNNLLLPSSVKRMQRVLYSQKFIGAVCPCIQTYGREIEYETILEIEALKETDKPPMIMSISKDCFMIKAEYRQKTGFFDEKILLPDDVLMDYSFRGFTEGYSFCLAEDACLYHIINADDIYLRSYGNDIDRKILKEKWNMNYFNKYPNANLLSFIDKKKEDEFRVLEVGCDCGANLLEISNRYPNAELHGVEINQRAGEIASHIANVQIKNIEEEKISFENKRFDYIIFGDVLEHLRNPEAVLKFCRNELSKKDGKILACIPNLMHYSVMYGLINGCFTYTDMGLLDKTHIHLFTIKEILKMFRNSGYRIKEYSYTGGKQMANKEVQNFVQKLLALSDETEEYMYYAFQYLIIAE